MNEIAWTPVAVGFGAQVEGLDISAPIPPALAVELRSLWLERGLVLFRGQAIDDAAQVRLTEIFGPAPIHKASNTHVPSQRELITISYAP